MSTSNIRVLLVDDQAIIVEAVRMMLAEDEQIEFHACTSAAEALDLALQVKPTVILQDLVVDEDDGIDLVMLYRRTPELVKVPVVVLSSHEEPEKKVRAFEVGANDYVVKLPSALELIARVRYHSQAYVSEMERAVMFQALERANVELRESAYTDSLTGLRNRRFFHEWQAEKIGTGSLTRVDGVPPLLLALMDVDHFKQVNDKLGHNAGDIVLKEVAQRLRSIARGDDFVVRWGGEEFLYVGLNYEGEALERQAQRILMAVGALPIPIEGGTPPSLNITVSIGWTPWPWTDAPPEEEGGAKPALGIERSLALADTAIYIAKRDGRNRAFGVLPGRAFSQISTWDGGADAPNALRMLDGTVVQLALTKGPA
jgi:two-component system, chemotaxis family, response regulator WspR